jgi:glycosyltransferase involved in cell wall biosynthesis
MTPAITIVTPAWNAAAYIGETTQSVRAQSRTDWEWIVVDDGSTDETVRVLMEEGRGDERIRVIRQPNRGVSAARNRGLDEARGAFVALLDADDLWLPEALALRVERLERRPEIDFAYANLYRHNESTGQRYRSAPAKSERILENLLLWNGDVIPTICSNVVLRRPIVESGLRFDPRFSTAADLDFAFRLAARWQGSLIDEPLVVYRVRPDSMSRNLQLLEDDQIAVYRNAAALGLFHSSAFRRKCFSRLYLLLAGNWWVDGGKRARAVAFMVKAVAIHPPSALSLLRKALRRVVPPGARVLNE